MSIKINNPVLTNEDIKEMIRIRRHLHQYPEIGYKEFETSKFIVQKLKEYGYTNIKENVGGTGVVALLKEKTEGKVLLIRSDMDALPLQELNDVEYKSKVDGMMHACGHDGHMSILLTVAKKLMFMKDKINGQVKIIFQPAEEGLGGANAMVRDGVLTNPKVDNAIGLHIFTDLESGKVGVSSGPVMATVNEFHLKIRGKGGHGASPQTATDPIIVSANIINACQTIVSRNIDPIKPAVVTFSSIHGGTSFNIIPEYVKLSGTVRTFHHDDHDLVKTRFEEIVSGICKSFRATYELDYKTSNMVVVNDESMSNLIRECAIDCVGKDNLAKYVTTAGEDMSAYLNEVPGCFFFIGNGNKKKGITAQNHSPYFDIDEDVLVVGAEMFIKVVNKYFG